MSNITLLFAIHVLFKYTNGNTNVRAQAFIVRAPRDSSSAVASHSMVLMVVSAALCRMLALSSAAMFPPSRNQLSICSSRLSLSQRASLLIFFPPKRFLHPFVASHPTASEAVSADRTLSAAGCVAQAVAQ